MRQLPSTPQTEGRDIRGYQASSYNKPPQLPSAEELLSDADTLAVLREYLPNFEKLRKKFNTQHSKSVNIYRHEGVYLVKDFSGNEFSNDRALNTIQIIAHYHGCDNKEAMAILSAKLGHTSSGQQAQRSKLVPRPKSAVSQEPKPETVRVDAQQWERTMQCLNSNFHRHARSLGVTDEHLRKWNVGTDNRGNTVFGHQSAAGELVNLQHVAYLATGSRDKSKQPFYLKNPEGKKHGQCLYGIHMLREGVPVIVVESGKTAGLASFFYPQYDFVSTGGASGLSREKLKALRGKSGYVLHDADKTGRMLSTWKKLHEHGLGFTPVELFPERNDGYDLADALRDGLRPDLTDRRFFESLKDTLRGKPQKEPARPKRAAVCAPMAVFGEENILTFRSFTLDRNPESEYKPPVEERLLQPGQRLSELNLDFGRSQYIDSPTASGKTTATILSGVSFDMLVPTQDQARQVGHEYGIDFVSEGRQPTGKEQQVGTYNALEKFVQRDTSHHTLVIDEAHNLALSQGYRGAVLNSLLDHAPKYSSIVLLSGTPVKSCHPLLKMLPVTRVRRAQPRSKELEVVRYRNQVDSLLKRLERGKLQTVVLQDKEKSQDLATLLRGKGYAVECFNASTKEGEHHREIIEQRRVSERVDVLIVTGLFFEGLNVYNTNIGAVHLLSHLTRYHMAQLFDRYRHQAPEKLIQYRPQTADLYQEVTFNWDKSQAFYLKCAEGLVQAHQVREMPESEAGQMADSILSTLQGEMRHLTRFNGTWQVNYLGVDYLTVQAETKAMHANVPLMEQLLSEYGFYLSGVVEDSEQEQEHGLRQIADTRKEEQLHRQDRLLDAFAYGGMGHAVAAADSRDREEAEAAVRVLELAEHVSLAMAILLLRGILSASRYKLLRDQVRVQRYLQLRATDHVTTPETRMLDTIYGLFQPGETVTPDEVRKKLQSIRSRHFRTKYTTFSNQTAMRVLKQFFEVERTTRYNGGKENCYRILGTNPLHISFQAGGT